LNGYWEKNDSKEEEKDENKKRNKVIELKIEVRKQYQDKKEAILFSKDIFSTEWYTQRGMRNDNYE
jgi:hypothetical protein